MPFGKVPSEIGASEPLTEEYQGSDEKHALLSSEKKDGSSGVKKKKKSCGVYFGVKSYLHNFYEAHSYKDPDIYEDEDDFRYLLHPNPRRRRCPPVCWKIFLWIGVNLLVFGVLGILVGYLVPQKSEYHTVVGEDSKPGLLIDRGAVKYNSTLDMCKLIGLILFCVGGGVLAMALLLPSFLSHYCEDDVFEDPVRVSIAEEEKPPLSPIEMTIPSQSELKNVQPDRKSPESMVTKDGLIKVENGNK